MASIFDLSGQTAVVSGGTRGIGKSMALALAEHGANIILLQRDPSQTETKTAVEALGRRVFVYKADLADNNGLKRVCDQILHADHHDVSILVNCGGIQRRSPSAVFPDNDWSDVLQVNLTAVFTLCREFGAHMLERPLGAARRGSIINIASLLSFQGGLTVPAYAAAKGGVAQLTKALSNEWASRGVNVNAIAPGYVDTEMNTALKQDATRREAISTRIPMGRWGVADDFKGPIVFLASAASAYVSGEVLTVDGGWMGR